MKLDIKELLDFFDDKKDSQKGDANALIAMLGEELNASVYRHFRDNKVEILNESITQGYKKGKCLDRWIFDKKNRRLYQCEIKNWSATAIGGEPLEINVSEDERKRVVSHYLNQELNGNLSKKSKDLHPNHVTKVLLKMREPNGCANVSKIEPLLIYWMPISSDKNCLEPLSTISIKKLDLPIKTNFTNLYIFSVSLYLRQLYKNGKGTKFIDLDMPYFKHRMEILEKLQSKKIK
jgi:hypothetical protein